MSGPVPEPQLAVRNGPYHGTTYQVPWGRTVLGRGVEADIVLDDGSVSRRHAVLDRTGERVTLADLGSSNGTRVNRQRLSGSRQLVDGDVVALGSVELTFTAAPGAASAPRSGAGGRGPSSGPPGGGLTTGQLTRAMSIAAAGGVIGLLFESVRTWVQGLGGPVAWMAVGAVAAASGIATMLLSLGRERALRSRSAPQSSAPPPTAAGPQPYGAPVIPAPAGPGVRPARRRLPATAVVLLILLLCGAGGVAATAGAQRAVGWVQGLVCPQCEQGDDWLAGPAQGSAGGLTVTVTKVEVNSRVIQVSLTATNTGTGTVGINAGFSDFTAGGQTFRHHGFGDFNIDTVPGGESHGVFVYEGAPSRSATTATLNFTQLFGFGPSSLTVSPIPLRAPP